MDEKYYDAVIVGGGHNGLVCAFYLAKAGLKVKILEKRNIVGGAAVTEEFHPGFRNSTASYTVSLLNPEVIKDMQLKENGLKIVKRPISNFLPIDDKDYIKVGGSLEDTQQQFRKYSDHDANILPEYYRRIENVADVLRILTTKTPLNLKGGYINIAKTVFDLVPIARKTNELQEDLFNLFTKSAKDFLDSWFENDHIKACFGFDSVVGNYASPETPGSAYVLLHHVFGEVEGEKGAWGHALGGMGSITQIMKSVCEKMGVEITTNASVNKILVQNNSATGVLLEDGSKILSKKVISNLNPKLLFKNLVNHDDVDKEYLRKMVENYPVITLKQLMKLSGAPFKPEELKSVLNGFEEDGTLIKGFLIEDLHEVCWGRKELLEEAKDIPPIRDFVLPPSDPIAPYFAGIMKEKFGFGSAYLVFKNAEPVAAFKANTRNKIIEVKDYEGSEQGWRIVKEFAWEHQMPLETELRIGGKKLTK